MGGRLLGWKAMTSSAVTPTRALTETELAYLRATVRSTVVSDKISNDDDFRPARGIVYAAICSSLIWSVVLVWAVFLR
jgi:hypothetical protein